MIDNIPYLLIQYPDYIKKKSQFDFYWAKDLEISPKKVYTVSMSMKMHSILLIIREIQVRPRTINYVYP